MEHYWLKFLIYVFEDDKYFNLLYSKFGIRIIIHPKENGHNIPHVHIQYQNKEVVCSLIDGSVIKGNIQHNKQKLAQEIVIQNMEYFIESWNDLVNGITV